MRADYSYLPAFVFPVIVWAPEAATGDPDADGTLGFLEACEIATTYFPEPMFLGWTFVDNAGRSWEVTGSYVQGRADAWWTRALPTWISTPRYRRSFEFVERPPVAFDAVKDRMALAMKANPEFYSGYEDFARERLEAATSLSNLFHSEEAAAAESFEPLAWWRQWAFMKGRCSRLIFAAAVAVAALGVALAMWWGEGSLGGLLLVCAALLFASVFLAIAAMVRRLHDLGLSGWWLLLGKPWLVAQLYFHDHPAAAGESPSIVWLLWAVGVFVLGALTLWPGTPGPNRYGFGRLVPKTADA